MHTDLSGKKVVITGASQGLGKAIALRLATSGADVVLLARTPDTLRKTQDEIVERTGRRVIAYQCDVSQEDALDRAWEKINTELHGVDILVNNAGTSFRKPVLSLTREDRCHCNALDRLRRLRIWPAFLHQITRHTLPAPQ